MAADEVAFRLRERDLRSEDLRNIAWRALVAAIECVLVRWGSYLRNEDECVRRCQPLAARIVNKSYICKLCLEFVKYRCLISSRN